MDFKKYIPTFFILTLLTSCVEKKEYLNKTYEGHWMETLWTYQFKENGEFIFKTEGHYDFSEEKGHYILVDSVLLLNPDTDWSTLHGGLKTRLKIVSPECIRDYDNNFYCLTIDSVDIKNEPEFIFQSKVIGLIDTMAIVNEEKKKWREKFKNETLDFKVEYQTIIKVNNQEYYQFNLVRRQDFLETWHDLRFLVKKRPFEIYQHNLAGDSLTLIYKNGLD